MPDAANWHIHAYYLERAWIEALAYLIVSDALALGE